MSKLFSSPADSCDEWKASVLQFWTMSLFINLLTIFYLDEVIEDISKLFVDGSPSVDDLLSEARQIQY